jgi:hypothetical protein
MPRIIQIDGETFQQEQKGLYVKWACPNDVMISKMDTNRWDIHIHDPKTAAILASHEATTKETCVKWAKANGHLTHTS